MKKKVGYKMIKPSDFLGDRYILEKAIDTYGNESQVDMAIEEMSELTKALLKYRRALKGNTDISVSKAHSDILEEIADVEIMLGPLTSDADKIIVEALLKPFPNAVICDSVFKGKLRNKG
jgi:hypothetical protein